MKAGRVYVVCNALDDETRTERGINTDSPAGSRKVFQMCSALRLAGVQACVLSLGRGRANGKWRRHAPIVKRVQGVPVIYAPFWQARVLSEAVSLLAPAFALWRLAYGRRGRGTQTVVFYNAEPAYLPALGIARLLGLRCVLDLEDGRTHRDLRSLRGWVIEATLRTYERLCNAGAMLACSALAGATRLRPTLCYYGLAQPADATRKWQAGQVTAMLGGTLDPSTGADLLVETIRSLRSERALWAEQLVIAITGKGQSLAALQQLAAEPGHPTVVVHGRTTDLEYREILDGAEIGLALKPRDGALAQTTFPSKVVELASAGLLVLTTDISDVRAVLGPGALYLEQEDRAGLSALLRWAVQEREQARATAAAGRNRVANLCAPGPAGRQLAAFLLGSRA